MKSGKLPILPFRNQRGMVSITVTIVFIMVISLVVLGFSQVSRRNSREALDRHLSSQAFYAAETGVNDVMNEIAKRVEAGKKITSQTECTGEYTRAEGKVDEKNGVSYTCLLVNAVLDNQKYSNVAEGAIIIPLDSVSGDLDNNTYTWQPVVSPASGATLSKCPDIGNNPKLSTWSNNCPYAMLRIEIMPILPEVLNSTDVARQKSMTLFVYPRSGDPNNPSTKTYSEVIGTNDRRAYASCNETQCSFKIDGMQFEKAYAKVRTIYQGTPQLQVLAKGVTISEIDNTSLRDEEETGFENGQVLIDVTGKAQDVLRRIQVRMSVKGGSARTNYAGFSDYAIQSADSVCKLYEVSPTVNINRASSIAGCAE